MTRRHFFIGFQKLLSYYLSDLRVSVAEQVAIFLFRYARQLKFYGVSVAQQAGSVQLLEGFVALTLQRQSQSQSHASSPPPGMRDVIQAVYTMLSALHTELGGCYACLPVYLCLYVSLCLCVCAYC